MDSYHLGDFRNARVQEQKITMETLYLEMVINGAAPKKEYWMPTLSGKGCLSFIRTTLLKSSLWDLALEEK